MMDENGDFARLKKKFEKLRLQQPNIKFQKLHNLLETFGCRCNTKGSHYTYAHDYLPFPFTVVKPHGGDKRVDINDLKKAFDAMEIILEQMENMIQKRGV